MAEIKNRGFSLGEFARIVDLLQGFVPKLEMLLQKVDELLDLLRNKESESGGEQNQKKPVDPS
jgi:hypothetical protein